MRGHTIISRFMAALLCMSVCMTGPVYANTVQKEPGAINVPQPGNSQSKQNCRGQYQGKLLAVIVPCIRDLVQETTEYIADQFDEMLKAGATAFAVLVLTLFGVKAMTQEGDMKKDVFILLMKIGFVFLFMDNFGGYIPAVFGTIQESVEMVTSTLGSGNYQCDVSAFQGEPPWNYMDCVLGTLWGFAPKMVLGTSVFGLLGTAVWSGQFGAMLFMGGLFIFFFIIKLLLKAVYTYLMALLIVGFLIIISPIFIPLLMLGVSFQYFERWLRTIISVALQPMIVFAYVTLSFSILDKIMFDDQKGLAKLMSPEKIKEWQNTKSHTDATYSWSDHGTFHSRGGTGKVNYASDHMYRPHYGFGTGATMGGIAKEVSSFDFRKDRAKTGQDIFVSMVALIIIAYLLDKMLESLLQIAAMMLGGGFVLGKAVDNNPIEQKLDQAQGKVAQGAQSVGDAIKGMFSGGR